MMASCWLRLETTETQITPGEDNTPGVGWLGRKHRGGPPRTPTQQATASTGPMLRKDRGRGQRLEGKEKRTKDGRSEVGKEQGSLGSPREFP